MGPREALIEIGSVVARISPGEVVPLITPALRYTSTTFEPDGSGGFARVRRMPRFYDLEEGGTLRVMVGHVALVKKELERAGVQVTVRDLRDFDARATPSEQVIKESSGDVRAFLEAIAGEPRGLVEARGQADVLHLTALICRLFPRARIYIPVGTRRQVRWVRRELERILGARVDVFEEYEWPWEGGRLVCTLRTFDCHCGHGFEVVVYPDAIHAAVPSHSEGFAWLSRQRVYGILRSGQPLSQKVRLRLEGLYGPVVYRVRDPRGLKATVCVHWCLPPAFSSAGELSALARKRHTIWHNGGRNDLIASVARAFRAGDTQRLWEHGLLLAEDEDVLLTTSMRSVAILVESTEHGRELLRRLPEWHLWHAGPTASSSNSLPPGVKSFWDLGTLNKVIITLTEANRLESIYTDVLIIASGEGWPDAVPGFPPRTWRADHQVMIVDLADDFDPAARQTTLRRQRDYAGRGWYISGVPTWVEQLT